MTRKSDITSWFNRIKGVGFGQAPRHEWSDKDDYHQPFDRQAYSYNDAVMEEPSRGRRSRK